MSKNPRTPATANFFSLSDLAQRLTGTGPYLEPGTFTSGTGVDMESPAFIRTLAEIHVNWASLANSRPSAIAGAASDRGLAAKEKSERRFEAYIAGLSPQERANAIATREKHLADKARKPVRGNKLARKIEALKNIT